MIAARRIALAAVVGFILIVFGLFAFNFYRRTVGPDASPPVIFERTDRPARA
jgi:hypothetical protein